VRVFGLFSIEHAIFTVPLGSVFFYKKQL